MRSTTEIDFPRRDAPKASSPPRTLNKNEDLFKSQTTREVPKKVKKASKRKKASTSRQTDEKEEVVEPLTAWTISPGVLILGYVQEIGQYELKIGLPGGIVGKVPITCISNPYTKLLRQYAENPDGMHEQLTTLQTLFARGQTVLCKVVDKTENPVTGKYSVSLSLNPNLINERLGPSLLRHGMVLHAAVASVEDHGYAMDVGLKGLHGFLDSASASTYIRTRNRGLPLAVGQLLPCAIDMPELTSRDSFMGRVVRLSAKPKSVESPKTLEEMNVTLQNMLPGMRTKAIVKGGNIDGLVVECLTYTGCIHRDSLRHLWDRPEQYEVGQEVLGSVLYVHPVTRLIHLTLRPSPNPHTVEEAFGGLRIGDVVEEAAVVLVLRSCVYFKFPNGVKGIAVKKRLDDHQMENIKEEFSVGNKYRCRIVSLDYLDCLAKVSLKKSDLNQKFIPEEDLCVGAIFECTVTRLVEAGMAVRVAPGIQGFVRNIHMADIPLRQPEKKFRPGLKVTCKVLKVEKSGPCPTLQLTCKKSLLKSELPMLTSYEDARIDLVTHGVVALVNNKGLLVTFYNNVQGWVPPHELSSYTVGFPEKIFFRGQVVSCRVILCVPDEHKLKLSLKVEGKRVFATRDVTDRGNFVVGEVVSVRVESKSESGLDVKLVTSGAKAFLPKMHLSDHRENCPHLLETFGVGDVISDVLCFSSRGVAVVSRKPVLVLAARNGELSYKAEDMQPGMSIPMVVRGFATYGMFVETVGNVSGLVPLRLMMNEHVENSMAVGYTIHQSLFAKVNKVLSDPLRLEFTTRLRDCYAGDWQPSLELLTSYLEDIRHLSNYYRQRNDGIKRKLADVKVGVITCVTVTRISDAGLLCMTEGELPGVVAAHHLGDLECEVGKQYEAVTLHVDFEAECLELTLSPYLVRMIKNIKEESSTQVKSGQIIKCQAQLVKDNFVLVSMGGHAVGRLAYLPTRRHLNDLLGRKDLYTVGEYYHVTVKRVLESGEITGVLKHHDKDESTDKMSRNKRKSSKRQKDSAKKAKMGLMPKEHETRPSNVIVAGTKKSRCQEGNPPIQNNHDPVPLPQTDHICVGKWYSACVKSVKRFQLNILINGKIPARVHITEISPDIVEGLNPLANFSAGDSVQVRVMGFRTRKSHRFLPITHRRGSVVSECSLHDGPMLGERNPWTAVIGQQVMAVVKEYSSSCLWVYLDPIQLGKIYILNLSNNPKVLVNPKKKYQPGQAIAATIIRAEEEHVELSRTGFNKLEVGKKVVGRVLSARSAFGLFLKLPLGYHGVIGLTDIRDDYQQVPGTLNRLLDRCFVRCCIIHIDEENKQCQLSTRASRLKKVAKSGITDPEVSSLVTLKKGQTLRGFVKSATSKGVTVTLGRDLDCFVSRTQLPQVTTTHLKQVLPVGSVVIAVVRDMGPKGVEISLLLSEEMAPLRQGALQDIGSASVPSTNNKTTATRKRLDAEGDSASFVSDIKETSRISGTTALARLDVAEGFSWDWDATPNLSSLPTKRPRSPSSDSEDGKDITNSSRRKLRKKEKEKEEEEFLFKTERLLMDAEREPETVDDFDRLVMASPNSSIVWVRYMAFHLQQAEIDKARAVGERALKTIGFREEQEKLSVWVALLNLENLYGTTETLTSVFQRAVQESEPIKVYNNLVNIYIHSGKTEQAEQLYGTMVKKFRQDRTVWTNFGLFYMKSGKAEAARKLMKRCLLSLDKKLHVDVVAKFAQMEFKFGEAARGCTMFESILSNYPKRTDLWSVYLDAIQKQGNLEAVRHVFDRIVTLKLSVRKMKFFFTRYLEFEKHRGTEETVNKVREKALEYVES